MRSSGWLNVLVFIQSLNFLLVSDRYSQRRHWCQTHARWRIACTCHHVCPTAWRWHHRLQRQKSCSRDLETNSSRPQCARWSWWPAGLSLCPTMHCKKQGNGWVCVAHTEFCDKTIIIFFVRRQSCYSSPGSVPRARQNLVVIQETTAGQVTWR